VSAAERSLLLTCEHGGNRVPGEYRALFRGSEALLDSHRGWDPGALACARSLARALDAELIAATTTRLLVDLNRSAHNRAVFSELTRVLARDRRDALLARYHRPHWDRVRAAIAVRSHAVLHLGVHSFTPVWRGAPRDFEIGILYDPARLRERSLATAWQRRLRAELPRCGVRRNAPYRGDADGLTTALRREFPAERYLAFELELNQRSVLAAARRRELVTALARTLVATLGNPARPSAKTPGPEPGSET
jgi:predicted N-formylglutamate amidohydrolase